MYSIVDASESDKRYCLRGYMHIHEVEECRRACEYMRDDPNSKFVDSLDMKCDDIGISPPDGNVCAAHWRNRQGATSSNDFVPSYVSFTNEEQFMKDAVSFHGVRKQKRSSFLCIKGTNHGVARKLLKICQFSIFMRWRS